MSDVRLTATNPEDSSVVPVACNAKGELLLEEPIAPEFDGNLDGDLTVTGDANFAGGVTCTSSKGFTAQDGSGNPYSGIYQGNIGIANASDTPVIQVYDQGDDDKETVTVDSSGSASFKGDVDINVVEDSVNKKVFTATGSTTDGSEGGTLTYRNDGACYWRNKDGDDNIVFAADGSASFLSTRATSTTSASFLNNGDGIYGYDTSGAQTVMVLANGKATFQGDVIVGSRNKKWMLVEQGGLCHMVEQARVRDYPKLRDVFAELDVVEKALEQVMEKLRMVEPDGWPVWDGSDNSQ